MQRHRSRAFTRAARRVLSLTLNAATAATIVCAVPPVQADINIGVMLSLTGPAASLGIPERDTVSLWPKQIGSEKINVIVLDDGTDPSAAALNARKLVTEHKVDIIVGPSITPTSLAALQVAGESKTPMFALAGGNDIVLPQEGNRRWSFKMPPNETIQSTYIIDHFKANKGTSLALIGLGDPYGETFYKTMEQVAAARGVKVLGPERYNRSDTSVAAQVLKLLAQKPDAVMIVAAGTPGALPQIELAARGYRGAMYQTQAIANNDYLRVGGKAVEGTLLPVSPVLVAEQLPDANPIKKVALEYVSLFEAKHGAGTRSLFGAIAWDSFLFLQRAVPLALKSAKPGTAEFREALRSAIESTRDLVGTTGIFNMSERDHNGADERSQVLVRIENGRWKLVQ